MPLFYLIAVAAGAITVGATVTDAKRWTAMAPATTFDATAYATMSDCLTAASQAHAELWACGEEN